MSLIENKLIEIHNKLKFDKNELKKEFPEQLMILKHIKPTDCVLEFGGSIGRSSCLINYLLNDKEKHIVIEPNLNEARELEKNKNNNSFKFSIERSAISGHKLYSKGWRTYKSKIPGSVEVNTITLEQLRDKYKLNYNVLVIDNEGNFVDNLKDFPEILDGVRLLQIEHDFNSEEDIQFFYSTMKQNNFKMTDKFLKTERFGPGINWFDGIRTDPIFVSVWEK
jgi:hypothetical protein